MSHLHHRHAHAAAFTLMELALVISIIGLLVGAVIGGVSLLKQSELQTVTNDYSKYSYAVAQFRQQYGGLPGDIIDATNYWPASCNGNGNGIITDTVSGCVEAAAAWSQLVLGNYITGSFTGTGSSAVLGTTSGSGNAPSSRINGAGWSFGNNSSSTGSADWYAQDINNYLAFGAVSSDGLTHGPAITAQDALQVDKKIDDGSPAYGRIVAQKQSSTIAPSCTDDTADATANYNVTNTGITCGINISLTLK